MKSTSTHEFSFFQAFKAQLYAEFLLCWRNKAEVLQPVVFFIVVLSLFPLAINTSGEMLSQLAPGILWVIMLLATLFSAEHLFREDFRDGSLAACYLSPQPLQLYVLAKLLVHWLSLAIPLSCIAPLMALMLQLPSNAFVALSLSVVIGSLNLSLVAALGAALTVSIAQRSLLLALIVLPLYVPVLVFASAAVHMSAAGIFPQVQLGLLAVSGILALALMPLVIAPALVISLQQR